MVAMKSTMLSTYKNLLFILLIVFTTTSIAEEYIVKKGDSLQKILITQGFEGDGQALHQEVKAVLARNLSQFANGDENKIKPGAILDIPNYRPEPEPEPVKIVEPVMPASIGRLIVIQGKVEILRQGKQEAALSDAALYSGDQIITSQNTQSRLIMSDETLFELGPNTVFHIDEFNWNSPDQNQSGNNQLEQEATKQSASQESTGQAIVKLVKGVARAVTGQIGKLDKSNFKLKTDAGIIGIRGTDYTVRYCSGENCASLDGTSVAVVDGGVGLKNTGGEIELKKGEFARAESANSVPFAAPMPEGFLDLTLDISDVKVVEPAWWEGIVEAVKSYL